MRAVTPLFLVLTLLPLAGCLRLFPNKNVVPSYPDRGTELSQNPYDHRNAPEYSRGRVFGFRALYAEPDPFADAMDPVAPLPPQKVEAPTEPAPLPEGFAPVALVHIDMATLREGRTFEDLAHAVSEGHGVALAMPTQATVALKAPDSRRDQGRLVSQLLELQVDGTDLSELAKVEIADGLPIAFLEGQLLPAEGDGTVLVVAPAALPPPPVPDKGTLPVDNITTSYADITVNGKKLGQIPPLAKARIRNVKSGVYEVGFEVPNGFTWTERLATRNDLGPAFSLEGDDIILLERFQFDSGRASIKPQSHHLLDDLADLLEEHDEILKISIEGHTDSDGDDAFNMELSRQRAQAIVAGLVRRGIDPARLVAEGFGETKPVAPNTDAAGKAANRRVEIHVLERTELSVDMDAGSAEEAAPTEDAGSMDSDDGADTPTE